MEFPVKMMSKKCMISQKKCRCVSMMKMAKRGEVLGRNNINNIKDNIYWYRLCNDGMQETIISERANRNENQNKECETIDENKKPRSKRKKVVIKQTEEEQGDQPIRIESSDEEPGRCEPNQPNDFDHEPTIDEHNERFKEETFQIIPSHNRYE